MPVAGAVGSRLKRPRADPDSGASPLESSAGARGAGNGNGSGSGNDADVNGGDARDGGEDEEEEAGGAQRERRSPLG
jgi:hypothetical protein